MKLREGFDLLATAPDGVTRLRELILSLAVRGKLVPQDSNDESASILLKRIRAEKDRLIERGEIKRDKALPEIDETEQPYAVPKSWELARLGTLCSVVTDGEHLTPERTTDKSQVPLVTAKNVRDGFMDYEVTDYVPRPIAEKCWARCRPQANDILMVSVGATTGRLSVLQEDREMVLVRSVTLLRPVPMGLDPGYLALHLNSQDSQREIWSSVKQNAQPCLYLSKSVCLTIALPPLAEQARIVAKVDELMRLCDKLEARGRLEAEQHARLTATLFEALTASESAHVLAKNWSLISSNFDLLLDRPEAVDALEQTILHLAVRGLLVPQDSGDEPADALMEQVNAARTRRGERKTGKESGSKTKANDEMPPSQKEGWETVTFPDLCVIGGGATPSKAKSAYWEGSIPWVSPKDMKIDLISDAQDHVSALALEETRLPLVPTGSLLIVVRGMILAHSFPVALTQAEVTINQDMKSLTPIVPELGPYLALVCRGLKRDILRLVDRSTHGTCKLQSDKLFAFQFGLPPLAEQSRILARVDELRRLCADLRARLTARQTCQAHFATALLEKTAAAGLDAGGLALAA
uniref:restriction endonuclease subunit S n=1 Tax=Cupriavidus taiwanensis TaxID=164546 RepID=UPI003F4972FB